VPAPPPSDGTARAARLIATVGGLGDRLPAPGTTAGSLPATLLWSALAVVLGGPWQLAAVTVALTAAATAVGVWAAGLEGARRSVDDPGPVVIDEVAGQWLCFLVALPLAAPGGVRDVALFAAGGFFLFRFFDVVKPWPVRPLERLPGGIGIVADDLAAGALAGVFLALGWRLLGACRA
jgi:phosphatidylglycerophosphatase A